MTTDRDVDARIVRAWLQDGVTDLPDHVLDAVLDQVPRIRQEPRWMAGWRNRHVQNALKLAIAAAAVVVVAVAGLSLLPRSGSGIGGPAPSASPSPPASPSPSIASQQMRLNVTSGPEALHVTVDVPSAWHRGDPEPADSSSVVRGDTVPPAGMFVGFGTVANTYLDPCGHLLRTPAVGPTEADLVAALAEIPDMTATEPVQTTLGGRPATYIELTADAELPCPANEFYITMDDAGIYFFLDGPRQIARIWVLDVDGTRVIAWAFHFPEATAEALAEEQAIIDSIEFEPPS
jgi:hypothetical protein